MEGIVMYTDGKIVKIEDITASMAARRIELTDLSIRLEHVEEDIESRKIEITPEAWAGSNDNTRKLSETKCFQADPILIELRGKARELKDKITRATMEVESLRDLRRSEENQIKIYLADSIRAMAEYAGHPLIGAVSSSAIEESLSESEKEPIFYNAQDDPDVPF
jgi:hypothetical protein